MLKIITKSRVLSLACFLIMLTAVLKVSLAKDSTEVNLRPNIEYDAAKMRDPFGESSEQEQPGKPGVPGAQGVESGRMPLPAWSLQGLIWGGKFSQAIVNGKVVRIGDTIEGAKIIDINKEGLVLFYDNRRHIVRPAVVGNSENTENKT